MIIILKFDDDWYMVYDMHKTTIPNTRIPITEYRYYLFPSFSGCILINRNLVNKNAL